MKSRNLSGLLLSLSFVIISFMFSFYPAPLIETGSKIIWTFNKNAYNHLGIYFFREDYIVTPAPQTTTDYEYDQILNLSHRLNSDGIGFLYVNKPTKYLDDSIFEELGTKSYCNQNADKLLERLKNSKINTFDLRKEIVDDNVDIYKMFYRTDHHWTVPAGKWGAMKIAQALNNQCGYNIDLSIYNDNNYRFITTEKCWYGEQGAKFKGSSLIEDDYTLVLPQFETNYTIDGNNCDFTEGFICDINDHYHYNYTAKSCINNYIEDGSILFIGDSYDMVTEPFLSLSVHKIDFLIRREHQDPDFYNNFISNNDYDTVIICYASFMIGAHDDKMSANYRMFDFE